MNKYGGAELYFSYIPNDTRSVTLRTDALALLRSEADAENWWLSGTRAISFTISSYYIDAILKMKCDVIVGGVTIDSCVHSLGQHVDTEALDFRIVMSVNTLSAYCNGQWMYTYVFKSVMWEEVPSLYLGRSESFTITNIRRVELSDMREAVYVDYEATAESSIQSVIQQRPVQSYPCVGRSIAYTYTRTRNDVDGHHVSSYEVQVRDNSQLASDGLVYYLETGISVSAETAKAVGFITRLYRLSELNNGAIEAARRIQLLAIEKRISIGIGMRFDPRLEIGDVLLIDEVVSGTGTNIVDEVIIEDLSISLQNGNYRMQVGGRRRV